MEYVDGQTLRQKLTAHEQLDPAEAIWITEGILDALAYSHRMGIVHRDIKPANVMITSNGHVKVMDFGIARAIADTAATMTQTQSVVGTAQYLRPSRPRARPSTRAATSTRPGACSSSCSPAGLRSRATPRRDRLPARRRDAAATQRLQPCCRR